MTYQLINHKSSMRNFKTENANDILREYRRNLDPAKTWEEQKQTLESGAVLNIEDIATAKKID